MQLFRISDAGLEDTGSLFSVTLVSTDGLLGPTARRIVSLRGHVELRDELFGCLSALVEDPRLADVIVIDCDGFGGLEAVQRVLGLLCPDDRRAPVVLISAECCVQVFPQRRDEMTCLRAPVSSIALRLAMETVLQDRFPALAL